MPKTNSKEIGNRGERKIAKELSLWIWNDPHILKKEVTSGAVKTVYFGDIYPIKETGWGEIFPFYFEIKWGYENHTPTLLNFSIIEKWWYKCVKESEQSNGQEIILLIMNFKGRKGILLSTNKKLNIPYKCILNIYPHIVYCYDYKEMLEYNFETVFK